VSDLSALDRLATFKIGGGRSQPETHDYFSPSLDVFARTNIINQIGVLVSVFPGIQ
jgi:hypothetical protein